MLYNIRDNKVRGIMSFGAGELPRESVRDKGTLGHPYGRHGHESPWPLRTTRASPTSKRVVPRHGMHIRTMYGQGPERWQPRQLEENEVGTLAPTTARCKIGLVELLRDGSRCSWVVPNVPSPKQTRHSERKFGKNAKNPVKRERVERWLCTVDRLSDRDHLSTGKSEGYEGPFERDGTTRQGRGAKWHA
ncbi:hypothetical protein CRG98_000658 [Punica granatum]|uniref:Uncharacterized protein n=1 Tax=Punica granatum TaxID=22663 RepID=A0A2I0LFF0_PUNGR|nr:hypothetical protein CRG98_000658 [Punica granatum]